MITLADMMDALLMDACPSQVEIFIDDKMWNEYVIELHCVIYTIHAAIHDGQWEILDYTKE